MSEKDPQPANGDSRIERAIAGQQDAMVALFDEHRDRLKRMVELRMDRRLRGRIDASDVLQETYVDLAAQLSNYAEQPKIPFFVWMRRITSQRLIMLHRKHLLAAKRDPNLEVQLGGHDEPEASSFFLASQLAGQVTSASQRVMRDEQRTQLQSILEEMSSQDREIIALRHFEMLDNYEVAALLEISEAAAGMRHLRALQRLKQELSQQPDMFETHGDFWK